MKGCREQVADNSPENIVRGQKERLNYYLRKRRTTAFTAGVLASISLRTPASAILLEVGELDINKERNGCHVSS
jgi:hypothetical protein